MTFTPSQPPVDLLPDGRVRIPAPILWTGSRGDAVLIDAGTVSDGASRPWETGAIVDQWGRGALAFLLHDVLCDEANAWTARAAAWDRVERGNLAAIHAGTGTITMQGPRPTPPRFLGPDIDGALRLALRDAGVGPTRWLYWLGVRWGAAFGSAGRRARWWSTLAPVLALTVPALVVMLPAVVGALLSRALLALAGVVAWPVTRQAPVLAGRRARGVDYSGEFPRQLDEAAGRLAHAAAVTPGPAPLTRAEVAAMVAPPAPVGPTSGPQAVVHARRVAARQRDQEPAPWCASFLRECAPGCQPSQACARLCVAGCAPDGSTHWTGCRNQPPRPTR